MNHVAESQPSPLTAKVRALRRIRFDLENALGTHVTIISTLEVIAELNVQCRNCECPRVMIGDPKTTPAGCVWLKFKIEDKP